LGRLDGQSWHGLGHPNSEGKIALRVPHGLQNANVGFMTDEGEAYRSRRSKGKELERFEPRTELGTLNDDVEGFELIHYLAPVVLIDAADSDGKQVKDFRVTAACPGATQKYRVAGELQSDLPFERQYDGRYRTSEMLPDEDVKFTVTAPGYEPASETVRLGEGEMKELTITLEKTAETKS
jgi:hypothetical protein